MSDCAPRRNPQTHRHRSTKAEIALLDDQIIKVLQADHPQSVRHVFYRMTDPRLVEPVPKSQKGYEKVQRRCLALRRDGSIPYAQISDATRRGFHVHTFDGASDFIDRFAGLYRATLWTDAQPLIEVWCESRSIAGILQAECQRLAVSLYPTGGFSSATLCYEAAEHIDDRGCEAAVVLYVGDYDPAGLLIDQSIESELRKHLATPLTFRRLAVNEEQIEPYDLPSKPRKTTDRRRLDVSVTVEAEAMPAATLRRIVREGVESYLPPNALKVAQAAEQSEREGLRQLAGSLRGQPHKTPETVGPA